MASRDEVPDPGGSYEAVTRPGVPVAKVRRGILELGRLLGAHTRRAVPEDAATLGVVILRGGLLLYPGFAEMFPEMDFCVLAMERDGDGRAEFRYRTRIARSEYDRAILIDCVAATGGTLLTARRVLGSEHRVGAFQAAVLCSSKRATATLWTRGSM